MPVKCQLIDPVGHIGKAYRVVAVEYRQCVYRNEGASRSVTYTQFSGGGNIYVLQREVIAVQGHGRVRKRHIAIGSIFSPPHGSTSPHHETVIAIHPRGIVCTTRPLQYPAVRQTPRSHSAEGLVVRHIEDATGRGEIRYPVIACIIAYKTSHTDSIASEGGESAYGDRTDIASHHAVDACSGNNDTVARSIGYRVPPYTGTGGQDVVDPDNGRRDGLVVEHHEIVNSYRKIRTGTFPAQHNPGIGESGPFKAYHGMLIAACMTWECIHGSEASPLVAVAHDECSVSGTFIAIV